MKSYTLEHLKRHPEKKAKLKLVVIWSKQWESWWGPDSKGYTRDRSEAGVYSMDAAWATSHHCGPEKGIVYQDAQAKPRPAKGDHKKLFLVTDAGACSTAGAIKVRAHSDTGAVHQAALDMALEGDLVDGQEIVLKVFGPRTKDGRTCSVWTCRCIAEPTIGITRYTKPIPAMEQP